MSVTDPIVIRMRTPNGKPSQIEVHRTDIGVDLVFSRSSQGEMLVRLPRYAAEEMARAITSALTDTDPSPSNENTMP